jgi:hypothetical protein
MDLKLYGKYTAGISRHKERKSTLMQLLAWQLLDTTKPRKLGKLVL